MKWGQRLVGLLSLLCLGNSPVLFRLLPWAGWQKGALLILLPVFYLAWNIHPCRHAPRGRLTVLQGGYELLLTSLLCLAAQALLLCFWLHLRPLPMDWTQILLWVSVFLLSVALPLWNGALRLLFTCHRLRLLWRILFLLFWWVPLFQFVLFYRMLREARREYFFELARRQSEQAHAENQDCRTRYPLVLVHGIFFRDWQWVNYWGRIPRALQTCGATLYYGGQQSAAPVAHSAQELKDRILEVLDQTGAEKVNLIAHSKGGLDSRYAISCLGLAPYVASLTTINTPHRGCVFVQHLLDTLPAGMVRWIAARYNALFRRLGDEAPDFLGGVQDLASGACQAFNQKVTDDPGVFYQSVMTTMKSPRSAGFPLNITWFLVNRYDRQPNDGLVALSSAQWGEFLGNVTVPGRRGISHGDVIDLMREDIPGFAVRDFYIQLVHGLQERGF